MLVSFADKTILNEFLSITAQEFSCFAVPCTPSALLNEVLSITAQESDKLAAEAAEAASSMKS